MDKQTVAAILLFASTLDYRLNNEPDTVEAWAMVLDPEINEHWASKYARDHYRKSQTALTPSMMNLAWREHQALLSVSSGDLDAHCGFHNCQCAHIEPCYRGWLDGADSSYTSPCPVCRGPLSQLLDELPPLGYRTPADNSRIRNRNKEL